MEIIKRDMSEYRETTCTKSHIILGLLLGRGADFAGQEDTGIEKGWDDI